MCASSPRPGQGVCFEAMACGAETSLAVVERSLSVTFSEASEATPTDEAAC